MSISPCSTPERRRLSVTYLLGTRLVTVEALYLGMKPRLITEGNGSALLQAPPESEWLRTDTVVSLDEWA